MRSVALGLLALAAGCNQIWGLDSAILLDANNEDGPPSEAPLPVAHLTRLVPVTDATGAPQPPRLAPIVPAPSVQIGRLGEALMSANYDVIDGTLPIPMELLTSPGAGWRLVFTQGGVPHEVQWAPTGEGRFVVPYLGGVDRSAATGATLALTPMSGPASLPIARVYTTGAWTEHVASAVGSPTISYAYQDATMTKAMLGDFNELHPTLGDRAVLVNYTSLAAPYTMGRRANGIATFAIDVTSGNVTASSEEPWPGAVTDRSERFLDPGDAIFWVAAAADKPQGQVISHYLVGLAPSAAMPLHSWRETGVPLPSPPMIVEYYSQGLNAARDTASFHHLASTLPRLMQHQLAAVQDLPGGLTLVCGLTSLVQPTMAQPIPMPFFKAAIAGRMLMLGSADLAPPPMHTTDATVAPGTGTVDLTFRHTVEDVNNPDLVRADYYEVTLHKVMAMGILPITPVRTYVVTTPKVTIDRALLEVGVRYVFELRTIVGAPGAATGDFRQWGMPQSMSVIYSRPFLVQ